MGYSVRKMDRVKTNLQAGIRPGKGVDKEEGNKTTPTPKIKNENIRTRQGNKLAKFFQGAKKLLSKSNTPPPIPNATQTGTNVGADIPPEEIEKSKVEVQKMTLENKETNEQRIERIYAEDEAANLKSVNINNKKSNPNSIF